MKRVAVVGGGITGLAAAHRLMEIARELGLTLHRAETVGDHPAFIDMLAGRVAAVARASAPVPA